MKQKPFAFRQTFLFGAACALAIASAFPEVRTVRASPLSPESTASPVSPTSLTADVCVLPSAGNPACWYAKRIGLDVVMARVKAGANLRIASLSTGLGFEVRSLREAVAVNRGETGSGREKDGLDNDANGYADDAFGFDAADNASAPWDSSLALGSFASSLWTANERDVLGRPRFQGFALGAPLVPVRIVDARGLSSITTARVGLRYAALRGVRVIHLDVTFQTSDGQSLCDEIRLAGTRGALVVAPAGNSGGPVTERDFPAACNETNLVVVAATDTSDALAPFSSFGSDRVHVAAPGVAISGLDEKGRTVVRNGTSGASALVAGVALLVANAHPSESPAALKQRLVAGADDNPSLSGKVTSKGRFNAIKALGASAR